MKLTNTILAGVVVASLNFVPAALATPTVILSNKGYSQGGGGEFWAKTTANGEFGTFCIEKNEYFSWNTPYFYSIQAGAVGGGVSGGNPDNISFATDWLFSQYHFGLIPRGNAGAVQEAIWFFEGEIVKPANNTYVTQGLGLPVGYDPLLGKYDPLSDTDGSFGTAVMHLWSEKSSEVQDQLIHTPDGGTTFSLLGCGLAALGFIRRKLA